MGLGRLFRSRRESRKENEDSERDENELKLEEGSKDSTTAEYYADQPPEITQEANDFEMALKGEGGETGGNVTVSAETPNYTKEEKQALFQQQLFYVSKRHVSKVGGTIEDTSIVGTEVGTVTTVPPATMQEYLLGLVDCSSIPAGCGTRQVEDDAVPMSVPLMKNPPFEADDSKDSTALSSSIKKKENEFIDHAMAAVLKKHADVGPPMPSEVKGSHPEEDSSTISTRGSLRAMELKL